DFLHIRDRRWVDGVKPPRVAIRDEEPRPRRPFPHGASGGVRRPQRSPDSRGGRGAAATNVGRTGSTPSRVASSGAISKYPPVAVSVSPVPSQTTLSTRPIPPPTPARGGGTRV